MNINETIQSPFIYNFLQNNGTAYACQLLIQI
jgi:hypothetical protein